MDDSIYYKRTIIKERVASALLGEERQVRVFLPPGYNELISYPVIYCQDGEQFFNFGRIATHMNKLVYDEDVQPAIIVGVDVDVRTRTAEYAPDGERFANYCCFFAEELIPYIEAAYPIRRSREERILAGDSLGATVSLHLALQYRDLFSQIISLSGAYLQTTTDQIVKESDLSWLHLYMIIGEDEQEVKTERGTFDFLKANRFTKQLLAARGATLKYEEKPGKHIWGFWQNELPAMMKYFLQ